MICGKQLDNELAETCSDSAYETVMSPAAVGALAYTKEIKQSMYRFKYGNRREYAAFYGDIIVKLKGHIIMSWKPDVIIPVPLHASRYRKRGYNQAALIAKEIGRSLELIVKEAQLIRTEK